MVILKSLDLEQNKGDKTRINTEEPVLRSRPPKRASNSEADGVRKKAKAVLKKESKAVVKKVSEKPSSDEEEEEEEVNLTAGERRNMKFQCCPKKIYTLMSELSEEQRKAVEETGLASLLNMKPFDIHYALAYELVYRFNGRAGIQFISKESGRYQLTSYDAYDVYKIPHGERPVIFLNQKGFWKKDGDAPRENDLKVREKWASEFTLTERGCIRLAHVYDKMMTPKMKKKPDDFFKKMFILYAFGYLFDPPAERVVDMRLLQFVEDLGSLRNYNFCKLVVDRLGEAVVRFFNSEDHKKPHTKMGGCVQLLLVCYLQRYQFKGLKESSMLPLVLNWDNKRVRERFAVGLDDCFGQSFLDNKTYPVSNSYMVKSITTDSHVVSTERGNYKHGDKKTITFTFPPGVKTDEEIDALHDSGEERLLAYLKRNIEVVTHDYVSGIISLKTEEDKQENLIRVATQKDGESDTPPINGELEWWNDPKLHEIIDRLSAEWMNKAKQDLKYDMPSFDLLNEPTLEELSERINVSCSIDVGPIYTDVLYASEYMTKFKREMLPMKELKKQCADFCLFEDPARDANEILVYYSHVYYVVREDMDSLKQGEMIYVSIVNCWALLLNSVQFLRGKNLTRFCFGTELSIPWINLAVGTGLMNTPKNPRAVEEALVRGHEPTNAERKHMRKGIREWIKDNLRSGEINLHHTDLILVPLHRDDHYTLYVINFEKKKIQYIDNLVYDWTTVSRFLKPLVVEMSVVLDEFKHYKAKEMLDYEFEYVPQYGDSAGMDCGVFAMRHMQLFMGEQFTCNKLSNVAKRLGLRAEICAILCLADINQRRKYVLEDVDSFVKEKRDRINRVKEFKKNELKKKKKLEDAAKKKDIAAKQKDNAAKQKEIAAKEKAEEIRKYEEEGERQLLIRRKKREEARKQ